MLFYFTGTGNSLYVAKRIEASPISIPQAIHDADKHYRDDAIGVVCPVYGHEMPQMVKDFLKNASFETDYFYLVLTYGHVHGLYPHLPAESDSSDDAGEESERQVP
jgi:flavodoxin